MAVGEVLTGVQVSCHDGCVHVAVLSVRHFFRLVVRAFCAHVCRRVLVTCRVGAGCSVDG